MRAISRTLVLAGAIPFLVLAVGAYLGIVTPPKSWLLGVAFMPVWFPGMFVVACVAYDRSTRYVRIQPLVSNTMIVIRAHPRFAEAVADQGFSQSA
ncbi:hypothetical protein ACQPW1_47615 [Nocardia sp. CA-128927]|uniref:hypothetical protein n=1 Tax=Nocardia sp. CA-128927 TaxID=3239975 RepID=UPI003D955029